jgi:hypothetical protein
VSTTVGFTCPEHGHQEVPLSVVTLVTSDRSRVYVAVPCRECRDYWDLTVDPETIGRLLDAGVHTDRQLDVELRELTGGAS